MISVFIVEDNEDICTLLELLFSNRDGFVFSGSAQTGEKAINEIEALQPDVVLMDIGLPDISGVECIRKLKPVCPKTEFVVYTVSDQDETVFEALKVGATSYLMKTTTPDELVEAIKEVHDGGSPISSDIARKIINSFQNNNAKDEKEKRAKFGITRREEEMLHYLSDGMSYQEVADKMFISLNTLKTHIYNTYEKLQVGNKVEAINKYFH